jgi:segregation and condensation protein B
MEITTLIPHIEALVFASDKPLTAIEITELINNAFGFMEDKIVLDQVEAALDGIVEKYQSEFYPFEVKQSGGGWQFLTKRDFHKTIAQLNGEKFLKRLSAAAMETLSIIAYKQPITKSEIEAIRGVNCDYAVQKLLEKELVIISGRNENLPGKPLVYATSKNFMDYFGINNTDDLPKIKEVLADQAVEPTAISADALAATEETTVLVLEEETTTESLAVAPNGELIAAAADDTATATDEGATPDTAANESKEPDDTEQNNEEEDTNPPA